MGMHAAAARARAAQLDPGADLEGALGDFGERTLTRPEPWLDVLAPGSWD